MELDAVRAFVTLADTGSVSRAADELHITQSAVTRRLQRLEASLGTVLLDRTTRPLRLTAAGDAALERCRRLLGHVRDLRAATANDNLPAAQIRIGVAHALTEFTLTEPLAHIRRKFPKIALQLRTGWSRDLLKGVRSGALDAAVIFLPEGEGLPVEVMGKTVGKERLVLAASRRGNRSPVRTVRDLAGAQWILNPEGCAARATLRRALLRFNLDMFVAVETYNYELQLALVAQNRGIGLVPERILVSSRMKSHLRLLHIPRLKFPLTIWTVHNQAPIELIAVFEELSNALIEKF